MPGFLLPREGAEIARRWAIEVEAGDGLAVVVVEQDRAVGFCVAHDDAFRIDRFGGDGSDDVEAGDFVLGSDDLFDGTRLILLVDGIGRSQSGREAFVNPVANQGRNRVYD